MENSSIKKNQTIANIARQQPINPEKNIATFSVQPSTIKSTVNVVPPANKQVESIRPRPTLDQRIQTIQSIAAQTRQPTQSLFKLAHPTFQSSSSNQMSCSTKPKERTQGSPNSKKPITSPQTSQLIPITGIKEKSKLPFMQRFMAQHANHQNPECRKIASVPCDQDQDKIIPLYIFKDNKRAYKAAGEYGTNQYKFGGGRLVSYYPNITKVPNKAKFNNEFQKQVWIHMLETIGTYNLYTLLGKFEEEENIILHNVNSSIEVYINGLQGPIPMNSNRSLQAFELKKRNRNLIIQTTEKRTIVVIESVEPLSNIRRTPENIEICPNIDAALARQQEYGFKSQLMTFIRNDVIFLSARECHDETIMQEHLVEITITGYQGNHILSTIITPRVFVTVNPKHLGFEEDDLMKGKDELDIKAKIRKITKNKILIGYNIAKTLKLCSIFTYYMQGYIDLENNAILRRKSGLGSNKIKLIQLAKRFNIKTTHPMRTAQRCNIYRQLWKEVEQETLNILQVTEQYQEEDFLELQNQMEDEFTSIRRTPQQVPRKITKETSTSKETTVKNQEKVLPNAFTINTSPMKRLRITSEEDQLQTPILGSLHKKCRVNNSNIPKTCIINGELYQIQAIIANLIQEPDQTILFQTSQHNDSQGREIQKGGRNVGDHRTEINSENPDN